MHRTFLRPGLWRPCAGIIEGTIPSHEEHLGSFQISGDKKLFRSSPSMRSDGYIEGGPEDKAALHPQRELNIATICKTPVHVAA